MRKSSMMQNIMLEQIKAGQKIVFLNYEGGARPWNKWRSTDEKECIQNRWNARNLKRHLDHNNPERQIRKI